MPDIDFNYSGLGEACRVFEHKHARLLTVRERLEQRLMAQVDQMERDIEERRGVEPAPGTRGLYTLSGLPLPHGGIDLLHLYEQDCEWAKRVLRTVREMAVAYLVAMDDAFVGRWRQENGLPAGDEARGGHWYPAIGKVIDETLAELHEKQQKVPWLRLRQDVARKLAEVRALRAAVLHRDSEGIEDISQADFDRALEAVTTIVRALACVTHNPRDDQERQLHEGLIVEALEPVTS